MSGNGDFFLYPRDLAITWGSDPTYWLWRWLMLESQDYKDVEVAELLQVCWLEVSGKVDMAKLEAGKKYKVSFVVLMKESAYGWDSQVTLTLKLQGTTMENYMKLNELTPNKWVDVEVGEFQATDSGEINFSMTEIVAQNWKGGMIVKCAVIRPVYN